MNCMLLAVIGKYDGLKNPLRMLLLNLASVDLVATTLGLYIRLIACKTVYSGIFLTTLSNSMGYFYLGQTACKIEGFITFFCGSTRLLRYCNHVVHCALDVHGKRIWNRIFSLMMMLVERYLSICNPLAGRWVERPPYVTQPLLLSTACLTSNSRWLHHCVAGYGVLSGVCFHSLVGTITC